MAEAVVARAPGRVNLIGDHTDYTGGLCLPLAVDRWVDVSVEPVAGSREVRLRSEAEGSEVRVPLDVTDVSSIQPPWGRFVAAVVQEVRPRHGVRGVVQSTVPMGVGLSSSAALSVACALALGAAAGDRLALARLCQRAEHAARGVPTGLLDQLASVFGVAGHALAIDCTTSAVTPVALPPTDEAEVVVVPGPARRLADTAYAERVAECRRAEAEVGPLHAAGRAAVERITDPVVRRRARHVVTENERVRACVSALAAGELDQVGQLLDASHRSLSEDYESSTDAIDARCEALRGRPGVFGVRITGGGWGGAIVALARPGALEGEGWVVRAVDGAGRMPRMGADERG